VSLTQAAFDEYKAALLSQLEEKPKKLVDEFTQYSTKVADRTFEFDRKQRAIDCMKNEIDFATFRDFALKVNLRDCPSSCVEVYSS